MTRISTACKTAQQVKEPAAKPDDLAPSLGWAWWKQRTDSRKVSPALHTCICSTHTHTHS